MDLQTTNVWLAVIAITGVLQMAMMLAVAYYVTTIVRRAQHAIDVAVADTRPLVRQVSAALDDVSDLVERTRRAEASVTAMVDRVGTTVDHVKTVALTKIWPASTVRMAWMIFLVASCLVRYPLAPARSARSA